MIRYFICCSLVASLSVSAQAALVITSESGNHQNEQYFEKGEFVLMRDGRPSLGIDAQGNCWFIEGGLRVFDSCEEMLLTMNAMRDRIVEGLSADDRAMMERATEVQRAAPPAKVTGVGERKIAGYPTDCYLVGSRREVCISTRLLDEIKREMGNDRFSGMLKRFGESAAEMGGGSPEGKALAELSDKGFPMLDMQLVEDPPGLDSAMLKLLPEAERARLMEQLASGRTTTQVGGNQVSEVQKDAAMPDLDFSRYGRIGFKDFLERRITSRRSKWEGFPPTQY